MVKLVDGPVQPAASGVTVIVATTGAIVVFTPVKEAMLPEPDTGRPILLVVLVQLKTVPVTTLVYVIAAVGVPLHNT